MRKYFIILILAIIGTQSIQAQVKGTKIGYIDMEYILQNVPDYTEAQNQLEQKAQTWKQDIETKKIEINKLKDALKAESPLLTKQLLDERETEIKFLENEMLDYQQKRFGPNGDLILQKQALAKPIQDQVFTSVQDIAEAKKYDFIFDRSSDLTMLFAAKRFDISDQVIRVLNRTEKREQLTKKQLAAEQAKEKDENALDENPVLADRKKALEDKKTARDQSIADRKLKQEEKKKELADKRQQLIDERNAKKNGMISATTKTEAVETSPSTANPVDNSAKTSAEEAKKKLLEERAKTIEDRKKALEEKRMQVLKDREAKKAAVATPSIKTEETKTISNEGIPVDNSAKTSAEDTKKKQIEARAKIMEDRKKALEEKRIQVLKDREAKKAATVTPSIQPEETKKVISEEVTKKPAVEEIKPLTKEQILENHKKVIEERKKALEERKKKVLEEREALKKANEEKLNVK